MASGLFAQYEKEYCAKSTVVSNKVAALMALPAAQKAGKSNELDADVKAAEQILQRLDMEARSYSPEQSRQLLMKVKDYKADLAKLKEDARKAATAGGAGSAAARAELGLGDDYYQTSAGQRDRLLNATQRLEKTSDRIQQGRQQLLETEATGQELLAELQRQRQTIEHSRQQMQQMNADELGVSILSDLQRQRETILHSRDTLAGVDVNISRSRQILQTMSRRVVQNKVIMWGIISLLVAAIILVLWAKLH